MTSVRWLPVLLLVSLATAVPTRAADKTEAQMLDEHLQVVRGDIVAKRDSAIKTLVQVDEQHAAAFRTLREQYDALLRKYFDLMAAQVSPVAAGQFLQIERQFETMADLKVATAMPLAGE